MWPSFQMYTHERPTRGAIGSQFSMKKSAISRNPVNNFRFSRSRIFLLVIPSSILFSTESPLQNIEQLLKEIVAWYDWDLPGGCWIQFPVKKLYLCFLRSHQNCLSRHYAISLYISRLPDRKIRTLLSKKVANHASRKRPAGPPYEPMFLSSHEAVSKKLGMHLTKLSWRSNVFWD